MKNITEQIWSQVRLYHLNKFSDHLKKFRKNKSRKEKQNIVVDRPSKLYKDFLEIYLVE